ncbi:MAG: hypothetical protein ACYSR4_08690, partial [Planctomycetota bacterium]
DLLSLTMRTLAYEYGRSMTWSKVGQAYWNLMQPQALPIPVPSIPRVRDEQIAVYGRQQVYQSA